MSVVLTRDEETFTLSEVQWAMMLELGMQYGWSPAGTQEPPLWKTQKLPPERGEWNNPNYTSREGQIFLADDARRFAFALWTARAKGAMPFEGLAEFCVKGALSIS